MSLRALSGSTLTTLRAGFAATSMNSPGRKGFGTFLRALVAGFLLTLTLSKPGSLNSPTPRPLMWPSITSESASKTCATSLLAIPVSSEM